MRVYTIQRILVYSMGTLLDPPVNRIVQDNELIIVQNKNNLPCIKIKGLIYKVHWVGITKPIMVN